MEGVCESSGVEFVILSDALSHTFCNHDLAAVQRVVQDFENIVVQPAQAGEPGVCDILFLDLGPIFLDVLGLTVDLSQITLDINAVPGPGNLLGNLLCALFGLLARFDLNLIGDILEALLAAINQLL